LYAERERTAARCRRQVLDEYLNGRESREKYKEEEEKCNVCRGPEEEIEEGEEDTEENRGEARSNNEDIGVVETESKDRRQVF
jgi:hypothetical protein